MFLVRSNKIIKTQFHNHVFQIVLTFFVFLIPQHVSIRSPKQMLKEDFLRMLYPTFQGHLKQRNSAGCCRTKLLHHQSQNYKQKSTCLLSIPLLNSTPRQLPLRYRSSIRKNMILTSAKLTL